jgi:hypothetical protein
MPRRKAGTYIIWIYLDCVLFYGDHHHFVKKLQIIINEFSFSISAMCCHRGCFKKMKQPHLFIIQ